MKFNDSIVKRKPWERRDSAGTVTQTVTYPEWYGRWKPEGSKAWKWKKLYADKRASQKAWEDFRSEQERRAAGVITAHMDFAQKPVTEHRDEYLIALEQENRAPSHRRISKWMLDTIILGCEWKRLADISADSLRRFIRTRSAAGDSVEYQKKWVTRAKAFIHWLQREGRIGIDPLAGIRRPNSAKAKKPRARRDLTDSEFAALFASAPESRRWKYAFARFTGFRRGEASEMCEGDLRLDAPLPFIQLRGEWTKNGKNNVLPLHPGLVPWMRSRMSGDNGRRIFDSIPDMKTVAKDLVAAGVATWATGAGPGIVSVGHGKFVNIADERGQRVDFHALRHTFKCSLERTGASHTTCKALMRHADADITDGYSHARLAELADAVNRISFPAEQDNSVVRTGTDNQSGTVRAGHGAGHRGRISSHLAAQTGAVQDSVALIAAELKGDVNARVYSAFHDFAVSLLKVGRGSDRVSNPWPSTQVD